MCKSDVIFFKQNLNVKFNVIQLQSLLLILSMYVSFNGAGITTEKVNYRFGVFPHMPSSHVEKKYSPLALAFSLLLNKPVRSLDSINSIDKFRKYAKKGAFDKVEEMV